MESFSFLLCERGRAIYCRLVLGTDGVPKRVRLLTGAVANVFNALELLCFCEPRIDDGVMLLVSSDASNEVA